MRYLFMSAIGKTLFTFTIYGWTKDTKIIVMLFINIGSINNTSPVLVSFRSHSRPRVPMHYRNVVASINF